ncbi:MAG: transcriptional repressor NrdR [Clostridia bacterium]|nr:transcriptional repressor NrdR [Clostridia bacterium]MCR5694654.1 transcriptional regulator NrdR [Clostridia bacterium]
MKCPYCGNVDDKVVDSRSSEDGSYIRRRRLCSSCGERYTTFETVESIELMVIKKDGTRELFDRQKIRLGIMKACEKRMVTSDQIDSMVKSIEQNLVSSMQKEIPSETIGEMIMEKLKAVDKVAYVRFASVYREFKDVDTFMEELKKIITDK